jgi:transposase
MSDAQVTNKHQIPDALWEKLRLLLLPVLPKPKGGCPRMDDRQALEAIFFILSTGCQWNALPRSLGRVQCMTASKRGANKTSLSNQAFLRT